GAAEVALGFNRCESTRHHVPPGFAVGCRWLGPVVSHSRDSRFAAAPPAWHPHHVGVRPSLINQSHSHGLTHMGTQESGGEGEGEGRTRQARTGAPLYEAASTNLISLAPTCPSLASHSFSPFRSPVSSAGSSPPPRKPPPLLLAPPPLVRGVERSQDPSPRADLAHRRAISVLFVAFPPRDRRPQSTPPAGFTASPQASDEGAFAAAAAPGPGNNLWSDELNSQPF
ncbi:hypothetical protein EJB05_21674, partial [Eragrostis curvula]